MNWLTRLPGVGPVIARLLKTHAWRAWDHYSEVKGDRFAGAVTYVGFLAMFPLIAVSAAIAAAALSPAQMRHAEHRVAEQFPSFVSDQLDLNGLVRNAATVGLVGGVLLLLSGLGWVDTLRGSIRGVWKVEEKDGNFLAKKGKDLGILLGLGGVLIVSVGASALATALMGQVARWLGIAEDGAGVVLLRIVGICVAVAADFMLVAYLLRWLPGLHPGRRSLIQAALIGAVGFELLKLLLSGYFSSVAGKSMYGAFGTPVALLLWMNFMMRLLLLCAAWTATAHELRRSDEQEVECVSPQDKEQAAPDTPVAEPSRAEVPGPEAPGPEEPGTGASDRRPSRRPAPAPRSVREARGARAS